MPKILGDSNSKSIPTSWLSGNRAFLKEKQKSSLAAEDTPIEDNGIVWMKNLENNLLNSKSEKSVPNYILSRSTRKKRKRIITQQQNSMYKRKSAMIFVCNWNPLACVWDQSL